MNQVRGVLFADYVRMLRTRKDVDWGLHLTDDDRAFLVERIAPDGWYPMASFERIGNAIFREHAGGQLGLVRLWGRQSVNQLIHDQPFLLVEDDPFETVNRFRGLRATWFDFEALTVPTLLEDECELSINYGMGDTAEEAATWQTVGFFEQMLERAGATGLVPTFLAKSWLGQGSHSRVSLRWASRF